MRTTGGAGRSRRVEGVVQRADRVRASETPDGVRVDGTHALRLTIAIDGGETVRVFEAWPSAGHSSSRVARLLAAVGHGTGDPGVLVGERVVLTYEDGAYRVAVDATRDSREPATPATEDAHSLAEVAVGAGASAGILAVLAVGANYDAAALALGAVAAVVLLFSLGFDAWRTRDAEWSPRALPWAVGGLVPVLNVAVALAYLVQKAVVVTDEEDPASVWRDVLVGVVAAFAAGLALAAVEPAFPLALAVFVHAWAFAPLAVFLDARTDRHGDRRPRWPGWVAGAAVLGGAGALVYLMRTE